MMSYPEESKYFKKEEVIPESPVSAPKSAVGEGGDSCPLGLRDQFAIAVITGVGRIWYPSDQQGLAKSAYQLADALLAARAGGS